jgi:flagellar hook-associated protein 1 FlgK
VDQNGYGLGVHTGDVTRCINAMSTAALLKEESGLSYQTETASLLGELEVLSGTSTGGLYTALQEFETAWSDVAANPEDTASRTVLLQKASSLTVEFNRLSSRCTEFTEAVAGSSEPASGLVTDTVGEINSAAERLQQLNKKIYTADAVGRGVPELRDERDRLVRELSQNADVSVSPDYRITLGGQELVSADGSSRQELIQDTPLTLNVGGTDITSLVTGGKLAARLDARGTAQGLLDHLDQLAQTLSEEINTLFNSGYNLNGENPADSGYTLFTGTSAADLAVDSTLYDPSNPLSVNPDRVAAASTRAADGPPPIPNSGDNSTAQAILDLFETPQSALGDRSISEYWSGIETALSGAVSEANDLAETGSRIVEMLDERVQSQAGVNLDEELVDLMSAQRAYEACSKLFSTADKLLETLLNIV